MIHQASPVPPVPPPVRQAERSTRVSSTTADLSNSSDPTKVGPLLPLPLEQRQTLPARSKAHLRLRPQPRRNSGGLRDAGAISRRPGAVCGTFASHPRLLVDQVRYIGSLDGSLDAKESEGIRQLKEQAARVRSGDLEGSLLGAPAPYWADLEGRNVVTVALGLHKPVLLLQGGRDYQVTAADWKIWQERAAGHPEITLREYPSLNHLGISGTARSAPDDYLIPGQVDQGMIQDIADWMLHGALPD